MALLCLMVMSAVTAVIGDQCGGPSEGQAALLQHSKETTIGETAARLQAVDSLEDGQDHTSEKMHLHSQKLLPTAVDTPHSTDSTQHVLMSSAYFLLPITCTLTVLIVSFTYHNSGCGVVCKLLAYLGFLTTIQFTIKYLTKVCDFPYPAFVTSAHFLASTLFGLSFGFYRTKYEAVAFVCPTIWELCVSIVPIALMFALATLMTNSALLFCSIAFVQIIGATTPIVAATMALSTGLPFDLNMFWSTCLVALGCGLSIHGEMNFSFLGTVLAFGANVARALKSVLQQHSLLGTGTRKFDPCSLLFWVCLVSFVLMLFVSIFLEGRRPWQALMNPAAVSPWKLYTALMISCVNAAGLNICALVVTKELGAVGHLLLGQMKNMICFIAGVVVMKEVCTPLQIASFAVVLVGLQLYQYYSRQLTQKMETARSEHPEAKDAG